MDNRVQLTTNKTTNEPKKLVTQRLHFGETLDARAYSIEDHPPYTRKIQQQTAIELQQKTGKNDKRLQL